VNVKTVACLAGDGVGPELMAAATRALERVSKLHQLELDDRHLPFAGEAVTRSGHPLPAATRAGYRDLDAILAASPHGPALGDVLVRLRDEPETLDVIVTEEHLISAMVDAAAHYAGSPSSVAHAWLPDKGPGVFAPGTSEPDDVAGFGVVDPEGMLLTASLMLAEGLKRRSASRTLERAVGEVARRHQSHDTR